MPEVRRERGRRTARGFTLVEMMIAMAVGLIVLGALYGALNVQDRNVTLQDQVADMQQSARGGMEIMLREIMMAGYNPQRVISAGVQPGITTASATTFGFVTDLNGNGDTTPGSANPNENVSYRIYDVGGVPCLGRTINGVEQPIARNIESCTFAYYDRFGNLLAAAPAVTSIRKVQVSLIARIAKPDLRYTDPGHGDHYRRFALSFNVVPRNIGLGS